MVSKNLVSQQTTGRMYINCILVELGIEVESLEYIRTAAHSTKASGEYMGEVALEHAIEDIFRRMLVKVQAGERWDLPQERRLGDDERANGRKICATHPGEMVAAFRRLIREVLAEKGMLGSATNKAALTLDPTAWFSPALARFSKYTIYTNPGTP